MKYLLIAVLALSASSVSMDAFAVQKIIFCAETVTVRPYDATTVPLCEQKCGVDCRLDGLISEGWKIDTNMTKQVPLKEWPLEKFNQCICNGTQYVLSKVEKEVEVAIGTDKDTEFLKKEIELLKKEIELLKQENQSLKARKK